MITINLNAELFWLQLNPTCKDMPKTLSLGQYGMTRGVDRILKILEERGIRATFFTPGWVAEQYPDKLKAIVEKGHEIAALGYGSQRKTAWCIPAISAMMTDHTGKIWVRIRSWRSLFTG